MTRSLLVANSSIRKVAVACFAASIIAQAGCAPQQTPSGDVAAPREEAPSQTQPQAASDSLGQSNRGADDLQTADPASGRPGAGEASGRQVPSASQSQAQQRVASQSTPTQIPSGELEPAWLEGPTSAEQLRAEAAQLVTELVEGLPTSPDAQEVKARFHLLVGESSAARTCWEQALQLAPGYGYALHGLGKVAVLDKDFETAASYLEQALALSPESEEITHDLANVYTKQGALAEAAELLDDFLTVDPESVETHVLLGQAYLSQRLFSEAKDSFERALELYPDLPAAQQGLGTALLRLGEPEQAKQLLKAYQASRAKTQKNRTAVESFSLEKKDYAPRFVYAARVHMAAGNLVAAEKTLVRATVFDPTHFDAWTLLLDLYQANGRSSKAVAAAERMCGANPECASCFLTRGVMEEKAGLDRKAGASYTKVIALAPDSPFGYESLIRLNIKLRANFAKCIELGEKLVATRGDAADYELLGQCYVINAKYQQAQDALRRATEMDPNNSNYAGAMKQLDAFLETQREKD